MVTNFHGLRMRLIHKEQIDLQIPGNYFWPSDDRPFYRPTIERISNVCLLAHNWREEDFVGWLTIGDDIESWFDEIQNGYSDHFTYRYLKDTPVIQASRHGLRVDICMKKQFGRFS